MHTADYKLKTTHLHNAHCKLHTAHCKLHTAYCTLYTEHHVQITYQMHKPICFVFSLQNKQWQLLMLSTHNHLPVQCSVCSLKGAVFSAWLYSLQCTVYFVLCAVWSVQCDMCSVQYAMCTGAVYIWRPARPGRQKLQAHRSLQVTLMAVVKGTHRIAVLDQWWCYKFYKEYQYLTCAGIKGSQLIQVLDQCWY